MKYPHILSGQRADAETIRYDTRIRDFGVLARVAFPVFDGGIPSLTPLEMLLIVPARLYSLIVHSNLAGSNSQSLKLLSHIV